MDVYQNIEVFCFFMYIYCEKICLIRLFKNRSTYDWSSQDEQIETKKTVSFRRLRKIFDKNL